MATYQLTGGLSPTGFSLSTLWHVTAAWTVQSASATQIVLVNSDLTRTVVNGAGFALDGSNNPTAGTVSSVEHRSSDLSILRESITGLSTTLTSFRTNIATAIGGSLSGVDAINGAPGVIQLLYGFGGFDTFSPGTSTFDALGRTAIHLVGGGGADSFTTGAANPDDIVLNYALENGGGGVTVDFAVGRTVVDTFGSTDAVAVGITGVIGTNQADTFTGGAADESFAPGGGVDTINGGAGFDQISYSRNALLGTDFFNFAQGITVNFTGVGAGAVTDPTGAIDTFTNIERVRGTNFADTFNGGPGDDSFRGMGGADIFNGNGGSDEVDYRSDVQGGGLAGVTVNLAAHTATDGFGATDTLNGIERVRGTRFADTLTGDDLDNQLRGEQGDDILNGGGGGDSLRPGSGNNTIDGGTGYDYLTYQSDGGAAGVTITVTSLGTGTATNGFGGTDTFTNIEGFSGTPLADTFTGSSAQEEWVPGRGDDTIVTNGGGDYLSYLQDDGATSGVVANLVTRQITSSFYGTDSYTGALARIYGTQLADVFTGSGADETFLPSLGADSIDGAGGSDRLEYRDFRSNGTPNGVTVTMGATLGAGSVLDAGGATDAFTGIEYIRGTPKNDTFIGSTQAISWSGIGGNNTYTGGAGFETVDYANDIFFGGGGGISINMNGTGTNPFGGTDTLSNIDRVNGTAQSDTIIGNALANTIIAGDGIDIVYAGPGDDFIDGGAGASSVLAGEAGNDTIYGGAGNDYMIGGDGNDTMVGLGGIDSLYGGAGNDYLVAGDGPGSVVDGGAGANTLWGAGGADYIVGGEGADLLVGGASSDYLFGNAGDDTLYGGQGTDYIYSNAGNDFIWTDDVGSPQSTDYIYVGGGTGTDTIADFKPGSGANHDVLVIPSFGATVTLADMSQSRCRSRHILLAFGCRQIGDCM